VSHCHQKLVQLSETESLDSDVYYR